MPRKAALAWVAEKASDEGYQAVARLRLAGVLVEAKAYDEALKQLAGDLPKEFEALVADRARRHLQPAGQEGRGQGRIHQGLARLPTSAPSTARLVEVKLNAARRRSARAADGRRRAAASGAKP